MIRNIIWDVDGTMFDTYPAIVASFVKALADLGHSAPVDRVDSLVRISFGHCAETLAQEFSFDPRQYLHRFSDYYSQISLDEQPPFPGIVQVCKAILSLGGLNLVATHRSADGFASLLAHYQMGFLVSDYLSVSDGFPKKPDPALFNTLIQRHMLIQAQTLAVGDRDIDVLAGKAAGIYTCCFNAACGDSSPDYCIDDYGQLLDIIENCA